ncbi:NADPH-dependent FMN reductase [Zunongwangia pacifica]|uniref:NAD(P)H-dependent oxidoreductase n=1 Tax=Zunongwangia pacifica TaxID=2911062 RepID=A0A9X2A088_9FLAO|nr:NAD(P)H-dependent oxidoreductase [Zunongwangia pacifica]MCL6217819.1 NAD(P)H-dependent oxidoreductase [Zunongwangia pacifica]
MMKNILGFAGSNSSTSINVQLLKNLMDRLPSDYITKHIDVLDYSLPFYGEDIEKEQGVPENAEKFATEIAQNDALIITINEHNGSLSAYFKNLIDWTSRYKHQFLAGKKIFLAAASPGQGGASASLKYAKTAFSIFGGEVVETLSFPSFYDNFKNGIVVNPELEKEITSKINTFAQQTS